MIRAVRVRLNQGNQAIPDVRSAAIDPAHRGLPEIDGDRCARAGCRVCAEVCPTRAISGHPARIDLSRCLFCGDCARNCPAGALRFTAAYKLAADRYEAMVVDAGTETATYEARAVRARKELRRLFGRSFKIRQVSAGGCNGCEMELSACANVNFDMGRYGIDFVASPRHADSLLVSGAISSNMASALDDAWESTPAPRLLILAGACALSGGVFTESKALNRSFLSRHKPDLLIPGCPVHPLTVVSGILALVGRGLPRS